MAQRYKFFHIHQLCNYFSGLCIFVLHLKIFTKTIQNPSRIKAIYKIWLKNYILYNKNEKMQEKTTILENFFEKTLKNL